MQREPIGISDFKTLRTQRTPKGEPMLYCDKSLWISDILNSGTQVMLFTRPRRFGKTLNLSMLKYFFGTQEPLFDGLKIAEYPNIMENYRNYPVIAMSFKSMDGATFEKSKTEFKKIIAKAYNEFLYLQTSSVLTAREKELFERCLRDDFADDDIGHALENLIEVLYKHHNTCVVVLIDEYDVPLQSAYLENYLDDALHMLRPFLREGLKDNAMLFKGIITGVSRVSKESLFSGLNNFLTFDIDANDYTEYFGFTEDEVQAMIAPEDREGVKAWYNGYIFGDNTVVYNPWSIINFLQFRQLKAYWINTSQNELIKESLSADKMQDIQTLIEGGEIEIRYDPYIVLRNLKTNKRPFWNLMYTAGYLTSEARDPHQKEVPDQKRVHIPNKEVQKFFEHCVMEWFDNGKGEGFLEVFCEALLEGEDDVVQEMLEEVALHVMSAKDVTRRTQESFYHGLLLGITLQLKGRYNVESNREGGYGYYDIALFPNHPAQDPGVLIEVKIGRDPVMGLRQIDGQRYDEVLKARGCQRIETYGIAFHKKEVQVAKGGLMPMLTDEASQENKK